MKDKILISGTVMNSNLNSLNVYQELVDICSKTGNETYSPIDTIQFEGTEEEGYQIAMKNLKNIKMMIAEMTIPSTGQGMEIQEAINQNVPIVVIAKHNSPIPRLVKGSGKVKEILYYNEIKDIQDKLEELIR